MGFNEPDVDRLLAGQVPTDDPRLGKVSAFLGDLDAACPPSSTAAVEDHHLDLITREARVVAAARAGQARTSAPRPPRTRARRALAATGAGILFTLTAGMGAAAAMGVNPLQLLPNLLNPTRTTPAVPAGTPGPSPSGAQSGQPTQPPAVDPTTTPGGAGRPTTAPTKTGQNCGNGKGQGNATCTNGNSGKDKPAKDNPAKDKDDKAGKGKGASDKPAKEKPRKDKPGKDNPGKGGSGKEDGGSKGKGSHP